MKATRILLTLALLGCAAGAAFAKNRHLASFEKVWKTVKDKHWDLAGTGVDWDQVYERYKPKAEEIDTAADMRDLLNDMLGELRQSHFQILEGQSLESLEELEDRLSTGKARPGLKVALIRDRVFVVKVDPASDAVQQGVGVGAEILAIRGVDVAEIVDKVKTAYEGVNHAGLYVSRTLNSYLSGRRGKTLDLKIQVRKETKEVSLKLERAKGRYKQLLNIPSVYYEYESRVLEPNIGYVAFNVFILDAKTAFEADLKGKLADTDGLIIDLRDNPGGLGMLSVSIANRLVSEKGRKLGKMLRAKDSINFAIFPQKPIYDKPVAVLINGGSASTSEILAAGLQDLGRARLFGTRSAGAALPSFIEELPNGDRFQYAIADYVSDRGRHIEGMGVLPDLATPHDLDELDKGRDAAVSAAIKWMATQKKAGAKNETF